MSSEPVAPADLQRIFLLPGEYHITKQPKFIATLLGSCVSICVRNMKNGSAGMNHFLHDIMPETDKTNIGRYGDSSTRYMIESLLKLDSCKKNYQAKIFGGGAVIKYLGIGFGIGSKNIMIAKKILSEYSIPIIENRVGGKQGIKIYFNTSDFAVAVRTIGPEVKDFSTRNIRVLVVDDSAMVRTLLTNVINDTEGMEVVGQAADAFEARDKMLSLDPDVISLDIIMPKLDGLKFLKKIMQFRPTPVVIVSTIAKEKSEVQNKAQMAGAVGVIDKDTLEIYNGPQKAKMTYIPLIRTAAKANVTRGR